MNKLEFIEISTIEENKKMVLRVSKIEVFEEMKNGTKIFCSFGARLEVNEKYEDIKELLL